MRRDQSAAVSTPDHSVSSYLGNFLEFPQLQLPPNEGPWVAGTTAPLARAWFNLR